MGRGGKRSGSGRHPADSPRRMFSVRMSAEERAIIQQASMLADMTITSILVSGGLAYAKQLIREIETAMNMEAAFPKKGV